MFYVHKHEVSLQFGGPEEGGWWYDAGEPCDDWYPMGFDDEDDAYATCRGLNHRENDRRASDEEYSYSSVLSYRSSHYAYSVSDSPRAEAYPAHRPHYE